MKVFDRAEFPQAILHLDGDAFFASVHTALNPKLKGKPVVTGLDRGIASSMSYEAKKLGITRAMPIYQIRKEFPQVIVAGSDYDAYVMYSRRMQEIVGRYTSVVENYSIDECFADITHVGEVLGMNYEEIIVAIQKDIDRELGIGVSIGVAPTKVLAKLASKLNKPHGLKLIPQSEIIETLKQVPIDMVWGIGRKTYRVLQHAKIKTAYDFVMQKRSWVVQHFSINLVEIWDELRGVSRHDVHGQATSYQQSISHTRSFTPTTDKVFILSELMKNVEEVFFRARQLGLQTKNLSLFIKTKAFQYYTEDMVLTGVVDIPTSDVLTQVEKVFNGLCKSGEIYRASGITLYKMVSPQFVQDDLFGAQVALDTKSQLFGVVDSLRMKMGNKGLYLAGSMLARSKNNFQPSHVLKKGSRRLPLVWLGNAY